MQASDHEVIFFGEKDFKLMGDAGRKYLKEKGREQEILKQIDLSEFEEETKWWSVNRWSTQTHYTSLFWSIIF